MWEVDILCDKEVIETKSFTTEAEAKAFFDLQGEKNKKKEVEGLGLDLYQVINGERYFKGSHYTCGKSVDCNCYAVLNED